MKAPAPCRHLGGGHTGYSAHLGGALAGILVGANLVRNFRHERWVEVGPGAQLVLKWAPGAPISQG